MKRSVVYAVAPVLLLAGAGIHMLVSTETGTNPELLEERDTLQAQLEEAHRQVQAGSEGKAIAEENLANAGIQVSALEKRARVAEGRLAEIEAGRDQAIQERDEAREDVKSALEAGTVLNGGVDRLDQVNTGLRSQLETTAQQLGDVLPALKELARYRAIQFSGKRVENPSEAETLISRLELAEKKKPLHNPRVLNVDPKYSFIQVNLGRDNTEVGAKLRVRRAGRLVGYLTVMRVTDRHAFCQIDKTNTVDTPRQGDTIEKTN